MLVSIRRSNAAYSTNEYLFSNNILYQPQYLTRFGMAVGLQFRIDQIPIDGHFKATSIRRHKCDRLNHVFVILQQLICQAHGPTGVVSDCAINNFDFQHSSSCGSQPCERTGLSVSKFGAIITLQQFIQGRAAPLFLIIDLAAASPGFLLPCFYSIPHLLISVLIGFLQAPGDGQ